MITQKDLQDAIAECLAAPNPKANTCMMLAAFYIIQERLPVEISEPIESEFMQEIKGKPFIKILEALDETLTTLQAVNPGLYDKAIERIRRIK